MSVMSLKIYHLPKQLLYVEIPHQEDFRTPQSPKRQQTRLLKEPVSRVHHCRASFVRFPRQALCQHYAIGLLDLFYEMFRWNLCSREPFRTTNPD